MCRFFIDNQPGPGAETFMEPSADTKSKISQRINRFGRQGLAEGNKNVRKKISIDDLVKTLVRDFLSEMCVLGNAVYQLSYVWYEGSLITQDLFHVGCLGLVPCLHICYWLGIRV